MSQQKSSNACSEAESPRQLNLRLIQEHFAAVSQPADIDSFYEIVTEDFVFDMPFGENPLHMEGRDAFFDFAREAFKHIAFTLTITNLYPATDPHVIVAEYKSEGRVVATGSRYANSYVGVWKFRDGKIAAHREYADPTRGPA